MLLQDSICKDIHTYIYKYTYTLVGPQSYKPLGKMSVRNTEMSVTLKPLHHNAVLYLDMFNNTKYAYLVFCRYSNCSKTLSLCAYINTLPFTMHGLKALVL